MKCLVSRRFHPISSIALRGQPCYVPPWVSPWRGLKILVGHRPFFHGGTGLFFMGARMALTNTKLQRLQAKERAYQLADGGGLYVEVQPTGKKVWRMQYRLGGRGSKKNG